MQNYKTNALNMNLKGIKKKNMKKKTKKRGKLHPFELYYKKMNPNA